MKCIRAWDNRPVCLGLGYHRSANTSVDITVTNKSDKLCKLQQIKIFIQGRITGYKQQQPYLQITTKTKFKQADVFNINNKGTCLKTEMVSVGCNKNKHV